MMAFTVTKNTQDVVDIDTAYQLTTISGNYILARPLYRIQSSKVRILATWTNQHLPAPMFSVQSNNQTIRLPDFLSLLHK